MQQVSLPDSVPIYMWTDYVTVEDTAMRQIMDLASLIDQVGRHVVTGPIGVMPDAHLGQGCSIGTVFPTKHHVIPAAVGLDIDCGMVAVQTTLRREDLGELHALRLAIEKAVPHGRTDEGGYRDKGRWHTVPTHIQEEWDTFLADGLAEMMVDWPDLVTRENHLNHLGTLGTGNHFIELAADTEGAVWIVIHTGSRGIGNRIGNYFIQKAKLQLGTYINLIPNRDLAFLTEGTKEFDGYMKSVLWAQRYAAINRLMILDQVRGVLPDHDMENVVACQHNYAKMEQTHLGEFWVTRKGAIYVPEGAKGIIPGSMGERTFIVEGLGNEASYNTASHGAGRLMSRHDAKETFNVEHLVAATEGVECRKDASVLDEDPGSYKNLDDVMASQADIVKPIHTLKQFLCVKGGEDQDKKRRKIKGP